MTVAQRTRGTVALAAARGAPKPLTARQQRLVDPPMPDLLPALVPEPVERLVGRLRQDAGDRAAIEAAQLHRAAKAQRQSRGCWYEARHAV